MNMKMLKKIPTIHLKMPCREKFCNSYNIANAAIC